jgi:diguanylate cyclase (GGDEF)-like protein
MTGNLEQFLLPGALALLVVAIAWHAVQLRARLTAAERKLQDLAQRLEQSVGETRRASRADPLTGLANRRSFDETLEREWARAARTRQPLAVIMADIDRFKAHNDTYGHQAGDECIRQVAAVLKQSVRRPADMVARYGGEEFGIILPGVDPAGALAVAERMRQAVQALQLAHVTNVTGHAVTISLGVAVVVPDAHVSSAILVRAADEALYRAKAVGRNQVIVATSTERESETIPL